MNLRRFSRPDWRDDFFLLFCFDGVVAVVALLSSTSTLLAERWHAVDESLWHVLHGLLSVGETNAYATPLILDGDDDLVMDDDALCKVDTNSAYIAILHNPMSVTEEY